MGASENPTRRGIADSSENESIASEVKAFLEAFETDQRDFGARVQEEIQAGRITSNEGIRGFVEMHGPVARACKDAMRITLANSGNPEVFPLIKWLNSNTEGDQNAKVWDESDQSFLRYQGNQNITTLVIRFEKRLGGIFERNGRKFDAIRKSFF